MTSIAGIIADGVETRIVRQIYLDGQLQSLLGTTSSDRKIDALEQNLRWIEQPARFLLYICVQVRGRVQVLVIFLVMDFC